MIFVNEIAEIVHSMIDKYAGAANKNIGEAFLLVWKIEEEDFYEEKGSLIVRKNKKVEALADLSILGFVLTIANIKTSYKL